jgi:hypothetical protein
MKSVSLALFVSAIISFVLCAIIVRRMDFSKYKSASACLNGQREACSGKKDCCTVWDGAQCRKGKIVGMQCQSDGSVLPAVFAAIGLVLLISSIVTMII